ncbi:MAG TPA: hypothetical protein VFC78_01995 [Tepidisphaeraceae bacterium]|nr:hypothetical protein [Tepidisphaeraceae bacterium]
MKLVRQILSTPRWIRTYARQWRRRGNPPGHAPVHVLLCIADHYEPQLGKPTPQVAAARVESWVSNYPKLFDRFRDADGKPPRHTFFFPVDEYVPEHVDGIAGLCRAGYGEVEIHLHHDNDTSENLRRRLLQDTQMFRERHGLLPRDKVTGAPKYGFVHGNWALDNSRPDGRWCGVNNELDVLRETGCYADFTLPSFPSDTQTRKINSIYYAVDDPHKPKSHDWGTDVGAGGQPADSLLLIQGPLLLDWGRRKWGVVPRVENACIQGNQPPTMRRLDLWLRARVQVASRPDWFFVKLHTHGAPESNQAVVLGEPMVHFHEALARRAADNPQFHYHYVTAREMYNLAKAAEAGWKGSVGEARDFELVWP